MRERLHIRSGRPPVIGDVGVIGLVPDVWGRPWQVRQQVLTRLAAYFHVVWVDPAEEWRDLWLKPKGRRTTPPFEEFQSPGFQVYRPGFMHPKLYRPELVATWLERQRLRQAKRVLKRRGCRKTILYLWRPSYHDALDLVDHDCSCYHIDDEYTFSSVEQPQEERESTLIRRVDQVFIHSPALLEKKGHFNPHTLRVPNGVDFAAYASAHDEPEDLQPVPHPRIGYAGVIKTQLDFALLNRLAERHPTWSFVFVGPQGFIGDKRQQLEDLTARANVFMLGAKTTAQLPAYTQRFDVCMMPYAIDDYTKFILPLKLHEYLASGRPAIATPIRSLEDFRDVVTLARTADDWSCGLAELCGPAAHSASSMETRRRVAREYDWDLLVQRIGRAFCQRLGPEYLERFDVTTANAQA